MCEFTKANAPAIFSDLPAKKCFNFPIKSFCKPELLKMSQTQLCGGRRELCTYDHETGLGEFLEQ